MWFYWRVVLSKQRKNSLVEVQADMIFRYMLMDWLTLFIMLCLWNTKYYRLARTMCIIALMQNQVEPKLTYLRFLIEK